MDQRSAALAKWAAGRLELNSVNLLPVAGDASFRRYFRVTPAANAAARCVAMDAPPAREDCRPFVSIARHWHGHGIHVPAIIAADLEQGFLLLEDLGDELYLGSLNDDSAEGLYGSALKTLLDIQRLGPPPDYPLPPYDEALLDREMALFRDWLCRDLLGLELSNQEHCLLDTSFALLREAALAQPRVTVHRDYHSRNLMVTASNPPGVLDFQDAVRGPITYDLVSLIKDCYIRWPQARRDAWVTAFCRMSRTAGLHQADAETFAHWTELMGMQRHLKAAGIFARLYLRDGKPGFLADIPRTIDYLVEASSRQPALRTFHQWLQECVQPALAASLSHHGG